MEQKRDTRVKPGEKLAEKWTEEIALELGNKLLAWMKASPSNIFFDKYLILHQDLDDDIIYYLAKKFDSFKKIKDKAKRIQEVRIKDGAINKTLSEGFSKFYLICKHRDQDFKESKDLNVGGQKDNPVQVVDFSKYTGE